MSHVDIPSLRVGQRRTAREAVLISAAAPTTDPRGELLVVVGAPSPAEPARSATSRRPPTIARAAELADFLRAGDVVVLNDSATLPASLHGRLHEDSIEARLVRRLGDDDEVVAWSALLFGAGDWHTRTEDRPAPPPVTVGDSLLFGDALSATVIRVHADWRGRLVDLRFSGTADEFWANLYAHAHPIQYSHTARDFELWDVQNVYAGPPWSVEPPSAGRVLSSRTIRALQSIGVTVSTLTHAAGLSSTGDPELDARFPLPERYRIPLSTVTAIERARKTGGRVIAVGTTVLRALEGSFVAHDRLIAEQAETDLVVTRDHRLAVVDALLTGLHEHGTSHYRILEAMTDRAELDRAFSLAEHAGARSHELGDAMLLFRRLVS